MIDMPMGMHDQQRQVSRSAPGQQTEDRVGERHLIRIGDVTRIDQQGSGRADEQVHERCFERGAQAFAQNERLRVVRVHLDGRLRIPRTILGTFRPLNVHGAGNERGLPRGCRENAGQAREGVQYSSQSACYCGMGSSSRRARTYFTGGEPNESARSW